MMFYVKYYFLGIPVYGLLPPRFVEVKEFEECVKGKRRNKR